MACYLLFSLDSLVLVVSLQVGQALSIRPDLLSLAYLEQLQTLQDRVASFSNEEARSIIQEGLGKSADEVFMDMSPSPVAAASLGQVGACVWWAASK